MSERVLIIDSDNLERRRLRRALDEAGFEVVEAGAAIEGLFETLERDPDVILLAEEVPPLVAADLLLVLRRLSPAPVIVIGGGDDPEEISMLDLGADFYQRRPFSMSVIIARVRALIRRHHALAHGGQITALVRPGPLTPAEKRAVASLIACNGDPARLSDLVGNHSDGAALRRAARIALRQLCRRLDDRGPYPVTRPSFGRAPVIDDRVELRRAAG